jgi:hypothetical protein
MGALTKPLKTREGLDDAFNRIKNLIEPRIKHVLLVEPDEGKRAGAAELLGGEDLRLTAVGTAADAIAAARDAVFDLLITAVDLPERTGFDFIDEFREELRLNDLPVILYATRELTKKEELTLKRMVQTTVLKDVRSAERLVDDVALFLHRPVGQLPEARRQMVEGLHRDEAVLAGKKVLIVDDDIRNIFAMTSLLEPHKMVLVAAETGRGAIEALQAHPDIDVVLMDIMMPDMDGYDTMRAIRKLGKFRSLPIIALTAKAMKGDREKCIEAGASDYISKPVDTEQLLAMLRVWLHR